MADDKGAITEDIVLALKTNFETELTRAANQYSSFHKKIGGVSRSVESSVNTMYRQVSFNLSGMLSGVQSTVLSSIKTTRDGMRAVQGDAITLSKTYEAYVNRMLNAKNQTRSIASSPDLTPVGKKKILTGLQSDAKEDTIKTAEEMYRQLGAISERTSNNITKATKDSLTGVKRLAEGTKAALLDLSVTVGNNKDVTGIFSGNEKLEGISKQVDITKKALKEQGQRVIAAEKEMQNARLAMNSQTYVKLAEAQAKYDYLMEERTKQKKSKKATINPITDYEIDSARNELLKQTELADKLKAKQESYFQSTVANVTKAQQAYKSTELAVNRLVETFEKAKGKLTGQMSLQVKDIFASTAGKSGKAKEIFDDIKRQFDDLRRRYEKMSNVTFLKKQTVTTFAADVDMMKKHVEAYNNKINELRNDIVNLQRLHRKGLAPNAGPEIKQRQDELKALQNNVKEVTRMSNRASSELETISKKQAKGLSSIGWETIRNFRWQVAGLIYLAQRGIQLVQRTFFGVLDKIQEFRTSSMAIAASITYSMLGDVTTNFNKAFEYSKDLMMKMEMEAAKTILTLEDMSMLVKTFTQAGIVPEGKDDLKKISTIGTAIKILTEGMANAGVQMRQELYAIIQGRQRATDQVAMMFKMVGININEVLSKAKKEGKDLLDVLSEALEPFNMVNKSMAEDYSVQVEALQKIWDKIKRIGADNTYKEMSKNLKNINESLANIDTGVLTEGGQKAAFYVGMVMESMRLIGEQFVGIIMSLSGAKNGTEAWLVVFRGLHGAVWAVSSLIKGVVALIRDMMESFGGVMAIIAAAITGDFAAVKVIAISMWEDFGRNSKKAAADATAGFDSIHLSAEALKETLKNTNTETTQLLNKFKISKPEASETFDNLDKEIYQTTLASKSGVEKAHYEYKEAIDALADYEEAYLKKQKELLSALSSGEASKEEQKGLQNMLEATKEKLRQVSIYESALRDKRDKKIKESSDAERDQIAGIEAEYARFLESMEVAPKNPLEAFQKSFDKLYISLEEFEKKEKVNKEKMKPLWDSLFDYYVAGTADAYKEMDDTAQAFLNSMSSHRVLSPFEALNNEFNKLADGLTDLKVKPEQKEELRKWLPIFKEERMELARINIELDKQKALAQELSSEAEIYKLSIRPADRQKAEIMDLEAQYNASAAGINAEIDKIRDKWKNDPNAAGVNPEQETIDSLERQLENLGIVFEKHKRDIQEPFWKGLEDMYDGWASGLSDTLTEVLWDLNSFSESFGAWVEDIGKQIVNLFIKTMIVDNLFNILKGAIPGAVGAMMGGVSSTATSGNVSIGDSGVAFQQNRSGPYLDYKMANGGIIGEPVIGQGLNTGKSYMFGEKGSEAVIPTNKLGGNSQPTVNVNVINQTTKEVTAHQQKTSFDGKKFVVDVILEDIYRGGKLRSALGGR